MTYNVHLLLHLADCVRNCGPLWSYSAFHFESNNGTLSKCINGTTDVLAQVSEKYVLSKCISNIHPKPDIVCNFERNLYEHRTNIAPHHFKIHADKLNPEMKSFMKENNVKIENKIFYERITINNTVYTTYDRSNKLKNNDSTIQTKDGQFARIRGIFKKQSNYYLIIEKLIVNVCYNAQHIWNIINNNDLIFKIIIVSDIKNKCIILNIDNGIAVCVPPNNFEKD